MQDSFWENPALVFGPPIGAKHIPNIYHTKIISKIKLWQLITQETVQLSINSRAKVEVKESLSKKVEEKGWTFIILDLGFRFSATHKLQNCTVTETAGNRWNVMQCKLHMRICCPFTVVALIWSLKSCTCRYSDFQAALGRWNAVSSEVNTCYCW